MPMLRLRGSCFSAELEYAMATFGDCPPAVLCDFKGVESAGRYAGREGLNREVVSSKIDLCS